MTRSSTRPIRIAILDLYNGEPNQGMRALRELIEAHSGGYFGQPFSFDVFEVRNKGEVPALDFDVYISSGGPGSPFDGEGKRWELDYFRWLDGAWNHNERTDTGRKRVLFICHSFQMMVRFFEVAEVVERRSPSFGIFPVHKTAAGHREVLFAGLPDPFFAADFRHWQVVQPEAWRLRELGASIIALEKERPYIPLERALMGIRLSEEMVGLQFHPEADPPGMDVHFRDAERRAGVIKKYGEAKYLRILRRLGDPNYLYRTYSTVVPMFLRGAAEAYARERLLVEA